MLLGFPSCRALLAAAHLRTARRRPLTLSSTLSSPFRSTESRICGTPPLGVFFGRPTGSHEKLPEFQWLKLCNVFVVELCSFHNNSRMEGSDLQGLASNNANC
ncbi:unnamed protein product [Urochloa humidicola]